MLDKIRKYKVVIFIIVLLLTVGVPLVIHLLFKIDTGIFFFQAEWSAGDFLQYYASVLALIPTTILSIVALNYTINSQIDDDKWKKRVFISVLKGQTIDLYFNDINSKQFTLEIEFINLGDNIPEHAVLKRLLIYNRWNVETIQIPCYRKTFSTVEIIDKDKFKISIDFYDCPENAFNKQLLDQVMKLCTRGMITDEELEKETKKSIELELGLYCGNIVTPIKTSFNMYLQWEKDSNIYHYKCEKYRFRISSPMEEVEYENMIKEEN